MIIARTLNAFFASFVNQVWFKPPRADSMKIYNSQLVNSAQRCSPWRETFEQNLQLIIEATCTMAQLYKSTTLQIYILQFF